MKKFPLCVQIASMKLYIFIRVHCNDDQSKKRFVAGNNTGIVSIL